MKLLILDGNSVINRAFFGVRPLTTREGLYTKKRTIYDGITVKNQ